MDPKLFTLLRAPVTAAHETLVSALETWIESATGSSGTSGQ